MEEILALRIHRTIVGILGILGNGLVCIVIGKVPSMRTRTNAFIFHQAVVDLVSSVMVLLENEIPLPTPFPDNFLGWFLCVVWDSNALLFYFFIVSSFNLLALTMERYFAIVHPFKYQVAFSKYPRLKVGAAMAACWIIKFIVSSIELAIFKFENGVCIPGAVPGSEVLGVFTLFLHYFVPVGVMLFAYVRISVELKRGADRVGPALAPVPTARGSAGDSATNSDPAAGMVESLLQARRNTFKTLLIVFTVFVVCWTPNQVIFLMFNLGFPLRFNEWYYLLSVAMVASNCCVNPVIYAFKYRQFRNGLRQIFCRQRVDNVHTSVVQ